MRGAGDFPERLRLAGGAEEHGVELHLAALARAGYMSSSGGGATFATRSTRLAGGAWSWNTAVAAVYTASNGVPSHLSADDGVSMASRTERMPAPSDATALSASVSAPVWIIISPPTDSPSPPMRSRSTSARCWRNPTAALRSLSLPQPHEVGSPSLSPSPRRSKSSTP